VGFFDFAIPGRPTRVSAGTTRGRVRVVWEPPADGGLPITFHVTPAPSCPTCHGLTTPSSSGVPATTITGLTPGQTYTFKVTATDAAGTGPSSTPSNPITPGG
jgi:Fibronectin type III domain